MFKKCFFFMVAVPNFDERKKNHDTFCTSKITGLTDWIKDRSVIATLQKIYFSGFGNRNLADCS